MERGTHDKELKLNFYLHIWYRTKLESRHTRLKMQIIVITMDYKLKISFQENYPKDPLNGIYILTK